MEEVRFEEKQPFAWWAYAVVMLAMVLPAVFLVAEQKPGAWIIFSAVCVGALLILNLLCAVTRITRSHLRFHLGLAFPMVWKRIPLSEILEHSVVNYRPLRDAGGWGYRCGRYLRVKTWFFTASGHTGVLVRTAKGQAIFGSRDPKALDDALTRILREHR